MIRLIVKKNAFKKESVRAEENKKYGKMKALQIIAAAMAVTVVAASTPVHVLHMERQVRTVHYLRIHRIFQIIQPGKQSQI